MKRALLICSLLAAFPAYAQLEADSANAERVERLERDIMLMQRQLARSGRMPIAGNPTSSELSDTPAQLEVRLSAIEDELRAVRGKMEENEFQVKKLTETLEKLQKDTEFRFGEMSGAKPAKAAADGASSPAEDASAKAEAAHSEGAPPSGETTAGDGVLRAPKSEGEEDYASTPRDLYNYAFRLLNQTKYEESAEAFDAFTRKYPKDPLVGNAYYWRGETYYIRRDYTAAADSFRQGFEALPTGPKAPDNLLKLAMSLDALGRDKEACIVLRQVIAKFQQSSTSVSSKASQELKRVGCK